MIRVLASPRVDRDVRHASNRVSVGRWIASARGLSSSAAVVIFHLLFLGLCFHRHCCCSLLPRVRPLRGAGPLRVFSSYFLCSHRHRKMGKKKGGAAIGSAAATVIGKKKGAGTRVTNGAWPASIIKACELRLLRQDGVLSRAKDDSRVSGDEVTPRPLSGFQVMFLAFTISGLSLPLHPFVRGLLCF